MARLLTVFVEPNLRSDVIRLMRDGCSTNGAACRRMKIVQSNAEDILCDCLTSNCLNLINSWSLGLAVHVEHFRTILSRELACESMGKLMAIYIKNQQTLSRLSWQQGMSCGRKRSTNLKVIGWRDCSRLTVSRPCLLLLGGRLEAAGTLPNLDAVLRRAKKIRIGSTLRKNCHI